MQVKRRLCLAAGVSLPLSIMLDGCATVVNSGAAVQAIVDSTYDGENGAIVDGMPTYETLSQALHAAPSHAIEPWRIALRDGRYYEKLEVTQPNIHLIGESRHKTILTFDAYAGQPRPGSSATWATAGCATLAVRAPGFAATNMCVENGFDYLANDGKPDNDPTPTNDTQGVALMKARKSDRARFDNVRIFGHQDTLFVDAGRNYFKNCQISGGVDFIFGASQTVLEACEITSRTRNKPNLQIIGYVTAPSTQIRDQYGLVFLRCKQLKESALVPAHSAALGRPWHPAANIPDGRYADPDAIGSSVFIECFMEDHITSDGWFSMTGLQKSGPNRTVFLPEDSRFFEYKGTGLVQRSTTNGDNSLTRRRRSTRWRTCWAIGARDLSFRSSR